MTDFAARGAGELGVGGEAGESAVAAAESITIAVGATFCDLLRRRRRFFFGASSSASLLSGDAPRPAAEAVAFGFGGGAAGVRGWDLRSVAVAVAAAGAVI